MWLKQSFFSSELIESCKFFFFSYLIHPKIQEHLFKNHIPVHLSKAKIFGLKQNYKTVVKIEISGWVLLYFDLDPLSECCWLKEI